MTNDEEYEKAECIRIHGDAFWVECVAAAEEFNAELAWDNHQARVQAEREARLDENKAKIAALEARIDALERLAEIEAKRAALQVRIDDLEKLAEAKAKSAALQARIDAFEARMQSQEEVHTKEALPTPLPTRHNPTDPNGEEEKQGENPPEIVPVDKVG